MAVCLFCTSSFTESVAFFITLINLNFLSIAYKNKLTLCELFILAFLFGRFFS